MSPVGYLVKLRGKISLRTLSILGSGRSLGGGGGSSNPLLCSWQDNPMDRGAWWATVHGVPKSWIWMCACACTHIFIFRLQDHRIRKLFHLLRSRTKFLKSRTMACFLSSSRGRKTLSLIHPTIHKTQTMFEDSEENRKPLIKMGSGGRDKLGDWD